MGIDYITAKKLILLSEGAVFGRVLMLGRQTLQVKDPYKIMLGEMMEARGLGFGYEALDQADGFAETLFTKLGAESVEAMDFSDYEGAGLVHDLNAPVPPELEDRFDVIFDGGTTEHIFDVAASMDNINRMLAPGGIFVSAVPANNWFAHGFYQFGPELVYSYWKHGCGFDVLECSMLPVFPKDKEQVIGDPATSGRRPRIKVPAQRVHLFYVVRKGEGAHRWNRALQTDYVRRWSNHDIAQDRGETDMVAARKAQAAGG